MVRQAHHERKGGSLRIAGYAALFGVADGAGDRIRPGAFARALAEGGALPLLWQHDADILTRYPTGR
ncbi:HK97 family phage prohead protease [Croceibacterium soli]|uniref:HK97 family phage prohead protease n=1 Tax=Croceibacterium soli TaxID=1739690 RepID=UPI0038B3FEAD